MVSSKKLIVCEKNKRGKGQNPMSKNEIQKHLTLYRLWQIVGLLYTRHYCEGYKYKCSEKQKSLAFRVQKVSLIWKQS